ncbi:MAG: hypothetical protein ACRDPG_01285, partial [Nocardioidaceae bacterium]
VYVPQVLARGLGPEDMASYVGQQQRWSRGCLGAFGHVLRARLGWRHKLQYLLSVAYFLSGWTALVYMALPVVRITTGAQPLAGSTANQFLLHFVPYFGLSLLAVAAAGVGAYTFNAFTLAFANFWVHVLSSLRALGGRPGLFRVTPKHGRSGRQIRTVLPALAALAVLVIAAGYGLVRGASQPAMINNVTFASLHICVLLCGIWPALKGLPSEQPAGEHAEPEPAAQDDAMGVAVR